MNLFYFLLFFIGGCLIGVSSSACIPTKCEALFPRLSLIQLKNTPPSADNLRNICPALFEYMECVDELIPDCTGKRLAQLSFSDEEVAENATLLVKIRGLIVELCTSHTKLHKDYIAAVNCFKRVLRQPDAECYRDKVIVGKAKQHRSGFMTPRKNETDECIGIKAEMDCFSIQVREQCILATSNVLVKIRAAVRPFSYGICSWQALQDLKDDFIDYLIEEGSNRIGISGGKKKCKGPLCKKVKKPVKHTKWKVGKFSG